MKKSASIALVFPILVAACGDPAWDPKAATEFASTRANETHVIGKGLRDRCDQTSDLSDCRAWLEYQREIEKEWGIVSYQRELQRWEKNGPY